MYRLFCFNLITSLSFDIYQKKIIFDYLNAIIMKINFKKEIWLIISAFGNMFAILSWLQESDILSDEIGWLKGFYALITGIIVYLIIRRII